MNLVNFRDLKGLRTTSGQVIGKSLLRSGEVVALDQEAMVLLSQHGLTQIVDLRRPREQLLRPDDSLPGVNHLPIDLMATIPDDTSRENFLKWDIAVIDEKMQAIYQQLIIDATAQKGFRAFFETLASGDTVLFHCFAGKDRTGVAAALALEALGIPRTLIMEDYLVTNQARQAANEVVLQEAAAAGATQRQLASLKTAYEVKADYLQAAFAQLDETYGSIDGYFEQLGEPNIKKELQKIYLQEPGK